MNRIPLPAFLLVIITSVWLIITASFTPLPPGLANDILKHTNQFRQSRGKSALQMREDLNAIARKHSEDMAKGRRAFGHGGYNQREARVRSIYPSCSMAENVAYGARDGKEVVALWKNSSGHRKNMLGNYKYTGIGTASDRRGTIYYTQIFVR